MKKPKNIVEGCELGCGSLGFGIKEAFGGILCDPCRKSSSRGIGGFFLQLLKGSIGLITKPISGALDYVSYSAEGITGVTQIGGDFPREERYRYPRPVYGYLDITTEYKRSDALTYNI